jgi:hypothetical protein
VNASVPREGRYRLVWFQHFHKAGGTSIVEMAGRNGERLWPRHANGNPLDDDGNTIALWQYTPAQLTAFVNHCEAIGVTFVATDWGMPLLAPLREDRRVTLVTCVRRPLDRLVANFFFDVHYGYTPARTLDAYVGSGAGAFVMFDYYTRILSRRDDDPRPLDRQAFERVMQALARFDHCAVLERGLTDLATALDWFRVDAVHANRSRPTRRRWRRLLRERAWREAARLLRWPQRAPPAAFVARFHAESPWDMLLYEHVVARSEAVPRRTSD